ncbi:ABC transporter ATP-binding protein [Brucella rhizosphaerae]|uniref:Maltose transport protein MalK n=1 Tax=Brucella rhizosphaerae TaxID=571254 RepID=A0A256FA08_9HYPH|nr:ABC transporter ATP-binding protein [Brucella rhizosphaerae]OYR11648.1 maltose transport protein MalK [Brucella rhizosphaerae]
MMKTMLKLMDIDKFYGPIGKGFHAVKDLNMEIRVGEIIALLGSSGCGKTSTLRMIAGFEPVSRGAITMAGREVHQLPPVRRNVAMAFEGYSLYPTVNVRNNIAFALKAAKLPETEVARRVNEVAGMLEITDILHRMPSTISGGQQQRASLARALVREADLYLLDEPMGQLEPQLRTLLRGRIKHFIKEHGLTAILVTHDQTEANALADRIAVMEGGVLQQFASPQEIKFRPANLFTGTFVGEPPMNIFPASAQADNDGGLNFDLGHGQKLAYKPDAFKAETRDLLASLGSVVVGIRPYAVQRASHGVAARVTVNQWLGDQSHIGATLADQPLVLVEHERSVVKVGEGINVLFPANDLHVFDARSGQAITHGQELA